MVNEEFGFLTVRIRKCCRGPPLLPSHPSLGRRLGDLTKVALEELSWEPPADGEFHLCGYLQTLLHICGLSHLEVFDRLDGRSLVYYEAAARRAEWPSVWDALDPLLREHRAVYRRKYGGSGAPYLEVDVKPRLCTTEPLEGPRQLSQPELALVNKVVKEDKVWNWGPVSVRNTFVDFACPLNYVETISAP